MMSLTEKLAYIKGLCEGLELEGTTKESKVILALVDLLDEVTQSVSQLEGDMDQVFDEIDAIDEDLTDVEDALWDDDDEYDDDDDDCDCGCGCHDDDEECEGGLYEITCPKCGEVVCMDEDMLFSPDCACPNCGTSFEVDFDGVEATTDDEK
ncbi:MAG: hypothetical protein RR846_08355 [Oscillospiraceae bacterium]